jgi:hypothetical protein
VLLRVDDEGARPEALPPGTPLLNWVHGVAADAVTIVGEGGTVLRYDGAAWAAEPTPTIEDLWGVFMLDRDAAWAVGGDGRTDGRAVVLRRDAGGWSIAPLPALARPGVRAFFKVWASGPNDVWIVGQRGVILHHDGVGFEEMGAGTSEDLITVHGLDASHVVAVGGRGNGVVARFDGATWTLGALGALPGLNGVWLRSPETAYAVGVAGTLVTIDLATLTVGDDMSVGTREDFHAVFANEDRRLDAIGGNFLGAVPPYRGLAYSRRLGAGD